MLSPGSPGLSQLKENIMDKQYEARVENLEKIVKHLLEMQYPDRGEELFNKFSSPEKHFKGYLRKDEGPMGNTQ